MKRTRHHWKKSPLAGKTVRLKPETRHHLHREFGGREIYIINWWDRTFRYSDYAIEWSVYTARLALCNLMHIPHDHQVLLGKIDGRWELVHISELDIEPLKPEPVQAAA